jgi:hypothetical protein
MTRQNPIPGTPDMEMGQALALIPYLDMFNHEVSQLVLPGASFGFSFAYIMLNIEFSVGGLSIY